MRPSGSQRGRPNRVSSIPSTATGSGSTSSTAPRATTARCTVGHDTPCAAATSAWSRPSSTATATPPATGWWCASRAGTCATCSVNDARGQSGVRQRQRRLRHNTCARSPPQGRSRGRVSTQSFPDVDTVRHAGQRAASGSSVTNCTILSPASERTTRSTANPSRPNRHDASSLRSTTARGSPLAAPEHSEDQAVAGRPRSGAPHGQTSGCPVKRHAWLPASRPCTTSGACVRRGCRGSEQDLARQRGFARSSRPNRAPGTPPEP